MPNKQPLEILLENILSDTEGFIDSYLGTQNENETFEKIVRFLRIIFRVDKTIFDKNTIKRIEQLQNQFQNKHGSLAISMEKLVGKKFTGEFSSLPFKVGGLYADRNGPYIVYEKDNKHMWIKHTNDLKSKVDSDGQRIKATIHKNIINGSTDSQTLISISRAKLNREYIRNWIRKFKRKSYCYKCSTVVNSECKICYICSWFKCPRCGACGCGHWKSSSSH